MTGPRYQPADLLAHRGHMLLLDEILDYDQHSLRAAIQVREGKPFCDENGAPGWAGLEWLAQTAGAWLGAHQLDHGQRVDVGFLLGTRRYLGPPCFAPGWFVAEAGMVLLDQASGIAVMDGVLRAHTGRGPNLAPNLASARIKLFQPSNVAAFLAQQDPTQR